jgi:hypothetical protein
MDARPVAGVQDCRSRGGQDKGLAVSFWLGKVGEYGGAVL